MKTLFHWLFIWYKNCVDFQIVQFCLLFQRVQKWSIVPVDFSVPGGELGPTLKLKRHYVLKKYDTQINNFYNV